MKRYIIEVNDEINRCSNCPCVDLDEMEADSSGNSRDIYYCDITGQSAGYHKAQTSVMSDCPLQETTMKSQAEIESSQEYPAP